MTTEGTTRPGQQIVDPDELALPSRYHAPGCPENEERLEWHEAVVTTQGSPHFGKTVEVTRCADCGGQLVQEKKEESA
jgi:hypothetical protein